MVGKLQRFSMDHRSVSYSPHVRGQLQDAV